MATTRNDFYDLSSDSLIPDWHEFGLGTTAGTQLSGQRYYSIVEPLVVSQGFMIEAVVSADSVTDADSGARLWVMFMDPTSLMSYRVEVRLRDTAGTKQLVLHDLAAVPPVDRGAPIDLDWTATTRRVRIRLLYDPASSGSIQLSAEPSLDASDALQWDDSAATVTRTVPLSTFDDHIGSIFEIGFGNRVATNSVWESVHVAITDDGQPSQPYWPTPVPYSATWPAGPPAFTAEIIEGGLNDHTARVTCNCEAVAQQSYLAKDKLTLALVAAKAPYPPDEAYSSIPTGEVVHDFPSLTDEQDVSAQAHVTAVSGRVVTTNSPALTIDFTLPDVTGESVAPSAVDASQEVRAVFDATEPLGSTPTVTLGDGSSTVAMVLDAAASTGDHYEYTAQFAITDADGSWTCTAELEDVHGNPNTVTIGSVTLTVTLPDVTAASVGPSPVAANIDVVAAMDATETLGVGTTVTLSDGTSTVAMVLDAANSSGNHYEYKAQFASTDAEGSWTCTADLVDVYGNSNLVTIGSVVLDLTPPTLEILVQPNGATGPAPVLGPPPLNRYHPVNQLPLYVAVLPGEAPFDELSSLLKIEFSPTSFTDPSPTVLFEESLDSSTDFIDDSDGTHLFAAAGGVKQPFNDIGYYTVTATLVDLAGNPQAIIQQFRTKYPYFKMRQGYNGKNYNSPDILMSHADDLKTLYAAPVHPTDQGTLHWQFISNEDNYVGIRIHNDGNETGDCMYRIFCVPGATFTNLDNWALITLSEPADQETAIAADEYRISDGTNFRGSHAEWPTWWSPPPENPDQLLHTCVCAVLHSSEDPLILKDGSSDDVVINDGQFNIVGQPPPTPSGFKGDVMNALLNYPGTGAGYWNAVYDNDKVTNINFNIKVVAAGSPSPPPPPPPWPKPKKAKAMEELPWPKELLIPPDAPPFSRPREKDPAFDYVPWLHDKIFGWTPEEERRFPRPALAAPRYYTDRLMLRTRGLRHAEPSEILVDRTRFPRCARVLCRLPVQILSPEHQEMLLDERHPRSPWKGARPASPKIFDSLFDVKRNSKTRWVSLELLEPRVRLDGLRLDERVVWIDVGWAVLRRDLEPKTPYALGLTQIIGRHLVGNFDFHLRAYHAFDVPIVGDRRTCMAYRRTNPVIEKIPADAVELFDSLAAARAAGYRLDPRDFGPAKWPHLPDWLLERLIWLLTHRWPMAGRLDRRLLPLVSRLPVDTGLEYLRNLPPLVETPWRDSREPDALRLLEDSAARLRADDPGDDDS